MTRCSGTDANRITELWPRLPGSPATARAATGALVGTHQPDSAGLLARDGAEARGTGVMPACASAQRGARRPEDEEVVAQRRRAQRRCSAGPCDAMDTARASPSRATARRSVCRCRSNLAPLSASRLRRYPPSRSPIRRAVSPDHVCCPRWRRRSSRRRGSATRPESPQAPDRRTMGQRALARATCGEGALRRPDLSVAGRLEAERPGFA